uniref:recombinase family protein n=1 Tax=Escherichia coli TaxID=562 RepID=UPI0033962093
MTGHFAYALLKEPASMRRTKPVAAPMVARVYLRVSTDAQDLERQEAITTAAKDDRLLRGRHLARRHPAHAPTFELLRMIGDLQPGEVVIAEKIDRISRIYLCRRPSAWWPRYRPKAHAWPSLAWSIYPTAHQGNLLFARKLMCSIRPRASPRSVLEVLQIMLFCLALQMARDDYEDRRERQRKGIELARQAGRSQGRRADHRSARPIVAMRKSGYSINKTAKLAGLQCGQVKRIIRGQPGRFKAARRVRGGRIDGSRCPGCYRPG